LNSDRRCRRPALELRFFPACLCPRLVCGARRPPSARMCHTGPPRRAKLSALRYTNPAQPRGGEGKNKIEENPPPWPRKRTHGVCQKGPLSFSSIPFSSVPFAHLLPSLVFAALLLSLSSVLALSLARTSPVSRWPSRARAGAAGARGAGANRPPNGSPRQRPPSGKPCAPGGDNTGRHTEPPRVTHPSPRFRLEAALRGYCGNILRNVDDE